MNEFENHFNKFWLDSYSKYNKEGLSLEAFILIKTNKYMHLMIEKDNSKLNHQISEDPVLEILKKLDLDPTLPNSSNADSSKLFTNPDFNLNNRYLN